MDQNVDLGSAPPASIPVRAMQGHEVCADIHMALEVAHTVLTSRDERVADLSGPDLNEALLRELRALGVHEAAPYLIAMVALLDTAIHALAVAASIDRDQAWHQIRSDVLKNHCQDPDTA
jgi:hypothetical protein